MNNEGKNEIASAENKISILAMTSLELAEKIKNSFPTSNGGNKTQADLSTEASA